MSEAIIIVFDEDVIDLSVLVEIHLRTHSSTSSHRMRKKYRSAVYCYTEDQFLGCRQILASLQSQFDKPLITQILYFDAFKLNREKYLDYYRKNPEKPFCKNVIDPKLTKLRNEFGNFINNEN